MKISFVSRLALGCVVMSSSFYGLACSSGGSQHNSPSGSSASIPEGATTCLAVTQGVKTVGRLCYMNVNGLAITQGDMVIGPIDAIEGKVKHRDLVQFNSVDLEGLTGEPRINLQTFWMQNNSARWPGRTVPYEIDPVLTGAQNSAINTAIAEYKSKVGFLWVPHNGETNYAYFTTSSTNAACFSAVGIAGGKQEINIAGGGECVAHEMGHAIGLNHEQCRPDRDTYLKINIANVIPQFKSAFDKLTGGKNTFDIESMMEYPHDSFSSNGKDTITLIDGGITGLDYHLSHISAGDVDGINTLYSGISTGLDGGTDSGGGGGKDSGGGGGDDGGGGGGGDDGGGGGGDDGGCQVGQGPALAPAGTGASCMGIPDGTYCGSDMINGDSNTLYTCAGGNMTVGQVCGACQINEEGTADSCQ